MTGSGGNTSTTDDSLSRLQAFIEETSDRDFSEALEELDNLRLKFRTVRKALANTLGNERKALLRVQEAERALAQIVELARPGVGRSSPLTVVFDTAVDVLAAAGGDVQEQETEQAGSFQEADELETGDDRSGRRSGGDS